MGLQVSRRGLGSDVAGSVTMGTLPNPILSELQSLISHMGL